MTGAGEAVPGLLVRLRMDPHGPVVATEEVQGKDMAEALAEIGFDAAIANQLEIVSGKLTGRVLRPIVDSETKQQVLRDETIRLGLAATETLAIGDGANDLAMIRRAGLGVAYYGKPKLRDAADARIDHGDLSALLYAQGYARKDWIEV